MRHLTPTLILLLILSGCGSGNDDAGTDAEPRFQVTRLITVTDVDAISLPGQTVPASTDTVTLWLGPDVARRDVSDGSLLIHVAADRLTWLDHRNNSWTSQTGDDLRRQLAALAADSLGAPSGDQRINQLRGMMNVSVEVTDTGENSRLDGYHCRRWLVEQHMGDQTTVSELWLTRDIPVDWALLQRITQPTLMALPGGSEALAELARLDGFPVRSFAILEIMGRRGRTESRLLSVDTVEVSRSHFLPPAGYRPSGSTTPAKAPSQ